MEILFLLVLGLIAGVLGGLLGIGGSVIMIPAIAIVLGWPFHLAQAIAMTVNPAVAISAAAKHNRNQNVSWHAVKRVLPLSIICICVAAWLSNIINGVWLELSFGIFLIWVLWDQISYLTGSPSVHETAATKSTLRFGATGGITGTISGFLGIGGGLIQVPLLNTFCKIPIKRAIGTSSAIMFVTAIIGATVKDMSLPNALNEAGESSGLTAVDALYGSIWIIPGAFVGGWFGAKLTNVLPVTTIRVLFGLLVALASIKMIVTAVSSLL